MTQEAESLRVARERIAAEAVARTGILDLSDLALMKLPLELSCLCDLQALNCSNTLVNDLSPLVKLTTLQELDCSNTLINDLSPLVGLAALQELNCHATILLLDLSPLVGLTALQKLDCSQTVINDLSPLAGLTALQELDCSETQVNDLSPLARLTALQVLYCSETQVNDLSPLAGLAALQSLDCYATRVSDLAPLARLTALQVLYCSETQVNDLSPVARLTALQVLYCSETQVNDLSPLAGLAALQSLDCSRTQIIDLSPLIGLSALQTLDCSGTKVGDLSPLAGLFALQSLDCSDTSITDLSSLAGLTALQELNCCYATKLHDLSPLANLTALQKLNCSQTTVNDLSPLASLAALQELECDGCSLSYVPEHLINNGSLKLLCLYEAEIPGIPSEVLSSFSGSSCLESLRAYLYALQSGRAEVTDTKLLILGNGLIGKTQICRRLRGEPFFEHELSTHGVIVRPASLPQQDGGQPQKLDLWDFGGQDIYHSTHALFMRGRAIFLLVWIPQAENISEYKHEGVTFRNQPLSYWLAYIRNLSGLDNPVLVLQTRCDQPEDEVRRLPVADEALESFRFFKALQYSSLKNRGRAALVEALLEAARWLWARQGKIEIGKGWMRVKQRLEAMREADAAAPFEQRKHRTLSQEYFHQLCAEEHDNVGQPEFLLKYLHDSGMVFYRKGLFHDQIVLDQDWALEAIYCVFNREKCYRQLRYSQGRFHRSLLEDLVWQNYSVDEQKLFLDMMQSCGISFIHQKGDEGRGIEHQYIAPDFLPSREEIRELTQLWDTNTFTEKVVFEYEWHHSGLLRSFMSKIGTEAGLDALYWKDGLYLYENTTGSRALIEQEVKEEWKGLIRLQTQKGKAIALLERLSKRLIDEQELWGIQGWKTTSASSMCSRKWDLIHSGLPESPPPKLEFTQELGTKPECCISYAWGDETEEGSKRESVVNQLCEEAKARGVRVLRDKSDLGLGEELLRFMKRVAHGERVFVVLSDKYLKSFNCMFELTEIWNYSRRDPEEFACRTRVYALPCVNIFDDLVHEEYVEYWESQVARLKPKAHSLPPIKHMKYRQMQTFILELGAILETIASRRMPGTLAELAQCGLDDLGVGR